MVDIINRQRLNCPENKKLSEKDMSRIYSRTGGIFNENDECILWRGYITYNKINYINFYFRGIKCALHRLLYINFKGHLNENDYLEFTCDNKGICCNINHIKKKKKNNNKNINIVFFD